MRLKLSSLFCGRVSLCGIRNGSLEIQLPPIFFHRRGCNWDGIVFKDENGLSQPFIITYDIIFHVKTHAPNRGYKFPLQLPLLISFMNQTSDWD
jgi:hypothetical protein